MEESTQVVNWFSTWGQSYYRLGLHFGHTFTGHNDPCFPHTGRLIKLRRILSIVPYPVLWICNLDELSVKWLRFRMRRFCRAHAEMLPLSANDRSFFDLIFDLSLEDMALIYAFLKDHSELLSDRAVPIERFGHRIRIGEQIIEFKGMKHFSTSGALELFEAVRQGKYDPRTLAREFDTWQTIEMPAYLRSHMLLDSPYLF